MSEQTVMINQMGNVPSGAGSNPQVRVLAAMLNIARIDQKGDRIGSKTRRTLIHQIPATLSANELDAWRNDDDSTRRPAAELLLTEAIESTSIIQEQVQRTVLAGAEKMKIIRTVGASMYNPTSNALRVPLGATQNNANEVSEGAEIKDLTQDYDKRDFAIKKYGVKPRISFEMVEDGLIDTVAEEIFYSGASLENRLNYNALTELCTAAKAASNVTTLAGASTAGGGLAIMKKAASLVKADGFFPDTIIMNSAFEADLMSAGNLSQAMQFGNNSVIVGGNIPKRLYGMNTFVTDNGNATVVDGTNPWAWTDSNDVGALIMEAKRGCGIAIRRDVTIKKFSDIVRELETITATMRFDVQAMHTSALATVNWTS
jgi:HK97 family phage major capsid protein